MGHACTSVLGTTDVPELADRLYYTIALCKAWVVVATMNRESTGPGAVTHGRIYDRERLMSVYKPCILSYFMYTSSCWLNIVGPAIRDRSQILDFSCQAEELQTFKI